MITIRKTDLQTEADRNLLVYLLNEYAKDPFGGGEELPATTMATLGETLRDFPTSHVFFAYSGDEPCGLCTCIEGFSTFAAKPLMNIHDMAVLLPYRGRGISTRLLEEAQKLANERGCCKLTLEVLSNNVAAKGSYRKFGFSPYELGEGGAAEFWQKKFDQP